MKMFPKNASLNLYRQRLELMREMYQNEAEVSPSSPDPQTSKDINLNADPFYDRFPWYAISKVVENRNHELFFFQVSFSWKSCGVFVKSAVSGSADTSNCHCQRKRRRARLPEGGCAGHPG